MMEINNETDFNKYLKEERERVSSIQERMNNEIIEMVKLNISERRNYYLHITTLALGFSGLVLFTEKVIHKTFFYIGVTFLFLVFICILQWFREVVDLEGKELKGLQTSYNEIFNAKKKHIDKTVSGTFSKDLILQYLVGINVILKDPVLSNENDIKVNNKKDDNLNYFGEFIICSLLISIYCIILSLIKFEVSIQNIIAIFFGALLIFTLSFQDYVLSMMKIVSRIANFLHKRIN